MCGNQAATYAIRARGRTWAVPHPGRWLVLSSAVDLSIATTLAARGWFIAPLPPLSLCSVLVGAAAFALLLDFVRIPVFRRLEVV